MGSLFIEGEYNVINAKDFLLEKEKKALFETMGKRDWYVTNGNKKGDEEGELTYSRRNTVKLIDYVIKKTRGQKKLGKMFRRGKAYQSWKKGKTKIFKYEVDRK